MIKKIGYVELYVTNIVQATSFYQNTFGFEIIAQKTFNNEIVSNLLTQGDIQLILTSSKNPGDNVTKQVNLHGDFVKDISFEVIDIEKTFNQIITSGFKVIEFPTKLEYQDNIIIKAKIATFGDIEHTLIEKIDCNKRFILPDYPTLDTDIKIEANLQTIDHVAIAVDNLYEWKNLYKQGLNFYQFYQETIETKHTGMDSVVMNSLNNSVKFVFVAPKKGTYKSQIEKFLEYNGSCGIQHLAFSTQNILDTIKYLKQNSIEFLSIPDSYYENLPLALKEQFKTNFNVIKELGILLDQDDSGSLQQIFTKPIQTKPTFFLEIIQREGSSSFGKNNIMALFKAVEKQLGK